MSLRGRKTKHIPPKCQQTNQCNGICKPAGASSSMKDVDGNRINGMFRMIWKCTKCKEKFSTNHLSIIGKCILCTKSRRKECNCTNPDKFTLDPQPSRPRIFEYMCRICNVPKKGHTCCKSPITKTKLLDSALDNYLTEEERKVAAHFARLIETANAITAISTAANAISRSLVTSQSPSYP